MSLETLTKPKTAEEITALPVEELLSPVLELLSDESHWVKGTFASWSNDTETYCLLGAARKVHCGYAYPLDSAAARTIDVVMANALAECVPDRHQMEVKPKYNEFITDLPVRYTGPKAANVVNFNDDDSTTHEDVINALKCAINKTKES